MVLEIKMHRKLFTLKFKRTFPYTFFIVVLGVMNNIQYIIYSIFKPTTDYK